MTCRDIIVHDIGHKKFYIVASLMYAYTLMIDYLCIKSYYITAQKTILES